jgi:hypothetical protein
MFGPTESNDINLIPPRLQGIYKNPYRVFGLDENNATISMVLRLICPLAHVLAATPHLSPRSCAYSTIPLIFVIITHNFCVNAGSRLIS